MLISDNLPVRKNYFSSNVLYRMKMQGYCDIFLRIILKQMSTEAHDNLRHHQGAKFELLVVSNVIHHKFSRDTISYTLSGEKVIVKLECVIIAVLQIKRSNKSYRVYVPQFSIKT